MSLGAGGGYGEAWFDSSEITKALKVMIDRGDDLSPVMSTIAETLQGAVDDMFETEGNGEWAALKQSTVDARRKGPGKGSPKILQDTGRLAGSFRPHSEKFTAEASTGVSYAVYHVAGTKHMVSRSMVHLVGEVYDEAEAEILEFLTQDFAA